MNRKKRFRRSWDAAKRGRGPGRPISTTYCTAVIAGAILWFCYSITGDRNAWVMIVSGLAVLWLLLPIVRRQKPKG